MSESGGSPPGTVKWRLHAARKRLSKLLRPERTTAKAPASRAALEGCAEWGISPTPQPWTEIEGRLGARAAAPTHRSRRFLPKTRAGVALAAALFVLFGMGAYAGFPLVYDVFREALPGSSTGRDVGTEIGQEQAADGAKVTLEYAYADAGFVVVGYSVQDTRENRASEGHPSELSPLQIDDTDRTPVEEEAELPPRVDLTDETGQDFDLIQGSTAYSADDPGDLAQPKPNVAIFAPSERLEPGEKHRFRLKVAIEEQPIFPPGWQGEIEAPRDGWDRVGPFAFDLEVPVRPVPVVEVGQKETAGGVTLTLERVLNSPGKPQAIVCLEPTNDDYEWRPSTAQTGIKTEEPLPVDPLEGGCWSLTIEDPVEGRSSVTVTEILGYPRTEQAKQEYEGGKKIEGPWTFEFMAPER